MSFLVDLFQPFNAGMGVDLRRRDRRVTKQLLNRAEIGARIQQVSGERVPKGVGAQPGALINLVEKFRHDELNPARAQPTPVSAEEKRRAVDPGGPGRRR